MKVGLSLSFCVQDLMRGDEYITDVAFIYSGTRARNQKEWDEVLDIYSETYWSDNPVQGRKMAQWFIERGEVIQPKLEGKYLSHGKLNWIDVHEFNEYCKENLHNEQGE